MSGVVEPAPAPAASGMLTGSFNESTPTDEQRPILRWNGVVRDEHEVGAGPSSTAFAPFNHAFPRVGSIYTEKILPLASKRRLESRASTMRLKLPAPPFTIHPSILPGAHGMDASERADDMADAMESEDIETEAALPGGIGAGYVAAPLVTFVEPSQNSAGSINGGDGDETGPFAQCARRQREGFMDLRGPCNGRLLGAIHVEVSDRLGRAGVVVQELASQVAAVLRSCLAARARAILETRLTLPPPEKFTVMSVKR